MTSSRRQCALMRVFTVGHQVCGFDVSASSKTSSWPRPPGCKVSLSSLSLSAPATARLSASWSGSPEWVWMTMDFYKKSSWGWFWLQLESTKTVVDHVLVPADDLVLGRMEVVNPKVLYYLYSSSAANEDGEIISSRGSLWCHDNCS